MQLYFFIISENADCIDYPVWGGGVGGGGCARKATKVKWASHYYQYYIHYVNQYACGLSSIIALLIFFVSYFKNL